MIVGWHRSSGLGAESTLIPRHRRIVDIEIKVVVGAVHVTADEPSGYAADEDVGGEVLLGEDAADADGGGKTVDSGSGKPAGVLGAEDGGHRPGGRGVSRGEGGIERRGAEEVAFGVVDRGAVAKSDELEGFVDGQRVG